MSGGISSCVMSQLHMLSIPGSKFFSCLSIFLFSPALQSFFLSMTFFRRGFYRTFKLKFNIIIPHQTFAQKNVCVFLACSVLKDALHCKTCYCKYNYSVYILS